MRKKVNGKVVDIHNIESFERAFEGMALGRLVSSSIADTVTENSELMNSCISEYETFYRGLPFPLYAIEDDIKYAAIGTYIKDVIEEPIDMWVDNALYIEIEEEKAIKFVGNTWGIVKIQSRDRDNTSIEEHSGDSAYEEFKWALTKMMNGDNLRDYYRKFMTDFVEACNNEPMVLKWELGRILEFGQIPEKLNLRSNRLLNIENSSEYLMDIFSTGKRKTNECEYIFSLNGSPSKQYKYIKTFDFELYEKKAQSDIQQSQNISKMQKTNIPGAISIFETLAGKGSLKDNIETLQYKGIMIGNDIIYQVDHQVFRCIANKYVKSTEIARNVDIHGYEKGFLYVVKRTLCSSNISKESTYAIDLKENTIRLCKIKFV